ncbi:MAG: MotA/TolQ/ExbB proton channel family protein [Bacteroidetes bacterium]|nr:MotA/TolQ/ExbB proton channel family protein [Bacteroidota bacterium]
MQPAILPSERSPLPAGSTPAVTYTQRSTRNEPFLKRFFIYSSPAITLFIAFIALIFFINVIVASAPPHSMMERLFNANDPVLNFVPFFNMFIFFWSLTDLLIKEIRIIRLRKQLRHEYIRSLPDQIGGLNTIPELYALSFFREDWKNKYYPSLVRLLLDNLVEQNNTQKSHEYFKHLTEIEANKSYNSYSLVKLMIWAMPILGFIGTVLGMGIAIGSFSGFLTGNIDDISVVKVELGKIATGLAYAFDKTLLCLSTAFITMILTTIIQKQEDMLMIRFEKLGLNILSAYKSGAQQPVVISEEQLVNDDATEHKAETVSRLLDTFSSSLNELIKKLDAPQARVEEVGLKATEFFKQISETGRKLNEQIDNSLSRQNSAIEQMDDINEKIHQAMQKANLIQEQISGQIQELAQHVLDSKMQMADYKINAVDNTGAQTEQREDIHLKTIESLNLLSSQLAGIQDSQVKISGLLSQFGGGFEITLAKSTSGHIPQT